MTYSRRELLEGPAIQPNLEEICSRLRYLLDEAVKGNLTDGILLSGGLDTSVLAVIASRFIHQEAFTVALEGAPAPDIKYATLMAGELGLEHIVHIFSEEQFRDAMPIVVKTTKSFDPMEIRNSIPIYLALSIAKENGIRTVMTGDGCDELLAGYSFLFNLGKERLDLELRRLSNTMTFSSVILSKLLKMRTRLPYLDPRFKAFALSLSLQHKIVEERERKYGKWILRKAYERILPREIVWRTKTPIEHGTGTSTLPALFGKRVSDAEFLEKRRKFLAEDGVTIRDKEQLLYYEIYRTVIGEPRATYNYGRKCPGCGCALQEEATYCRTCGAYPV